MLSSVAKLGLSTSNPYESARDLALSLVPSAEEFQACTLIDHPPRSPPQALEWLLDDTECRLRNTRDGQERSSLLQLAKSLVERLIVADMIRHRFWHYRLCMIERKF